MTTTMLPSTGLTRLLEDKIVFLDTNVFVGALANDELVVFLATLRERQCQVLTVSSAVYEFTRGSKTLEEFNDKREFVTRLTDRVISVGRLLENPLNDVFSLVMSKLVNAKDSDYTDFLLATCKDTLHHFVVYRLNDRSFAAMVQAQSKSKKTSS